jgi:phosphoserine phosphatase
VTQDARPPVAVVFDLDDTLAPDTTTQFLAVQGVDVEAFWSRVVGRMKDGWDQVPAYLYEFVRESGGAAGPFTSERMRSAARRMTLYPGVESLVSRLTDVFSSGPDCLEFYLISSGLAPIVQGLPISGSFRAIWSSDLAFDENGKPAFPSRIISFTDKTRPLVEISKGLTQSETLADPFLVNRRLPGRLFRIPFSRMVFVGDGLTDVPCFSLLSSRQGIAIAVFDSARPGARERAAGFQSEDRVRMIAETDYSEDGEAYAAIKSAIAGLVSSTAKPSRETN